MRDAIQYTSMGLHACRQWLRTGNNPNQALRNARDEGVVLMNREQPDAVAIGLPSDKSRSEPGARSVLATALLRDGGLSLVRGAGMDQMPLARLIKPVSRLGVAGDDT